MPGATRRHLDSLPEPALQHPSAAKRGGDAGQAAGSIRAVLRPMTGYVADAAAVFDTLPPTQRRSLAPWIRAATRAREALANAAAFLAAIPDEGPASQDHPPTRTATALHAATACMTAGRDLLHTHATSQDNGTTRSRSEWGPVVMSVPVARAVLHQVAGWAGKVAPHGGQAALTGMTGTTEQRRALNGACQWLQVLQWAVEAADHQQPLTARDLALLHAIPVNAPAPRHLPSGTEPVTALCHGIIGAAERARAAAVNAADRATWSQDIASESMRHIAAHCAVTSWNCHLLLRALAARPGHPADLAPALHDAADAADRSRAAWLEASQAWDVIVTDTHGGLSPAAVTAEDLAPWTGRLAHADPQWTPALSLSHAERPPADLPLTPADLRRSVTAAHHACHAIGRLAAASHEQLQIAATTRRLIIPTRNVPRSFGIPHQFSPAPPESASSLLSAYQHAAETSHRAAAAIAAIAEAVKAPSRVLTTAQAARDNTRHNQEPHIAAPTARLLRRPAAPGPAERVLLDLGITDRSDLRLAASLDHATSQLLLRAATAANPTPNRPGHSVISSAGTAELINHLVAAGHRDTVLDAMDHASGTRAKAKPTSRVLLRAELAASPAAPRQARQHLRQALAEQGLSALSDTAELLASELVANATEHAAGEKIGLVVRQSTARDGRPAITCEVSDHSATLPQQRSAQPGQDRGRSLAIIAALATDSGVRARLNGKTCWFTLTAPDPAPSAARQAEPEAEAGA